MVGGTSRISDLSSLSPTKIDHDFFFPFFTWSLSATALRFLDINFYLWSYTEVACSGKKIYY
jgi:hypothetical protein